MKDVIRDISERSISAAVTIAIENVSTFNFAQFSATDRSVDFNFKIASIRPWNSKNKLLIKCDKVSLQ